jgi:hypothetical protein
MREVFVSPDRVRLPGEADPIEWQRLVDLAVVFGGGIAVGAVGTFLAIAVTAGWVF